eukprot:1891924-Prymnesium_polylepis.1
MPTRRGTLCRPRVGRDPRKQGAQGEIPGAEKSAPELTVTIPGQTRKESPKSGNHIYTMCPPKYNRMRYRSMAGPGAGIVQL